MRVGHPSIDCQLPLPGERGCTSACKGGDDTRGVDLPNPMVACICDKHVARGVKGDGKGVLEPGASSQTPVPLEPPCIARELTNPGHRGDNAGGEDDLADAVVVNLGCLDQR